MSTQFKYPFVQRLWELTGEVGALAENNPKDAALAELYGNLSDALDNCEANGLIEYSERMKFRVYVAFENGGETHIDVDANTDVEAVDAALETLTGTVRDAVYFTSARPIGEAD